MNFTSPQEHVNFYQQVYTLQKRNRKHFHWSYAMFKVKFGEFPSKYVKQSKKIVSVTQNVLDFVNEKYKEWYDAQEMRSEFIPVA